MTIGDLLGAALAKQAAPEDALATAATAMIAAHYGLHPDEAGEVVWNIELELLDQGGSLARLLETRHGFATLGVMVAQRLLGSDEATALPLLAPALH